MSPDNRNAPIDLWTPVRFVYLVIAIVLLGLLLRISMTMMSPPWNEGLMLVAAGGFVLGCFFLAIKRPNWVIPLAVALIPLQNVLRLPGLNYRLTPSEIVVLVWLAVAIWEVIRGRRKIRIPQTSINPFLFIYVLTLTISLIGVRSYFSAPAIQSVLLEFIAQIYLVIFFFLLVGRMTGQDRQGDQGAGEGMNFVLGAWALGAFLAGLAATLALLHYPTGLFAVRSPLPLVSTTHKVTGLFRNSNAFASYILTSLLVFSGILLYGRQSANIRRFLILVLLLLTPALIFSQSQGAWIGMAIGVGLLLAPRLFGNTRVLRILLVISFVGLIFTGLFLLSGIPLSSLPGFDLGVRLAAMSGYELERVPLRIGTLVIHRTIWLEHPWIGVGVGGVKPYMALLAHSERAVGAHTVPVGVAAETGLVGLVAIFLLGVAVLWRSLEILRKSTPWLPVAIGATSAFIGLLTFSMSHDIRGEKNLWVIMAFILSIYVLQRAPKPFSNFKFGSTGKLSSQPPPVSPIASQGGGAQRQRKNLCEHAVSSPETERSEGRGRVREGPVNDKKAQLGHLVHEFSEFGITANPLRHQNDSVRNVLSVRR